MATVSIITKRIAEPAMAYINSRLLAHEVHLAEMNRTCPVSGSVQISTAPILTCFGRIDAQDIAYICNAFACAAIFLNNRLGITRLRHWLYDSGAFSTAPIEVHHPTRYVKNRHAERCQHHD